MGGNKLVEFVEKPELHSAWINGGYFSRLATSGYSNLSAMSPPSILPGVFKEKCCEATKLYKISDGVCPSPMQSSPVRQARVEPRVSVET
jgi:hypothetical protein